MLDEQRGKVYNRGMITANTPPRNRTKRRGRKRDRFLGEAIVLAVTATIAVAILLALVLILIPHTAVRDFWDLYKGQVGISPQSQVFQDIQQKLQHEQNYFVAPAAFLIGGLVFGMSAPRRLSRNKTILIGGMVALIFNLLLVGSLAAVTYHNYQHALDAAGRQTYTLALHLSDLIRQIAAILIWSVCSMAGAFLGTRKRGTAEASKTA